MPSEGADEVEQLVGHMRVTARAQVGGTAITSEAASDRWIPMKHGMHA